jgi:hypothetical protein
VQLDEELLAAARAILPMFERTRTRTGVLHDLGE